MYRKFYGLEKKPFDLAPVGGLVYLSEAHKEGVAILRYGVIADKGFLLLTGGVGAGKTTVLNTLLEMIKNKVRVCVLNNPKLSRHEFFHYLGKKLGIPYKGNKGNFIFHFTKLLDKYEQQGGKVLLIIDEAQVFPIDLLEEIRLLSNHAEARNVFSIFLIGQPELQEILAHPRLLPLRQRIGIRYHLNPLTREDTGHYITYRLNMAGAATSTIFEKAAIECIHEASQGNPRLINIICDHALITGFSRDMNSVGRKVITDCLDEIRLDGEDSLKVSELNYEQGAGEQGTSEGFLQKQSKTKIFLGALLTVAMGSAVWLLYNIVLQDWFPKDW